MARRIKITTEATGDVIAELLDAKNPKTAESLWNALPIDGRADRWGDEIYFGIPVKLDAENASEDVEVGDVGYWPPGNAFCIFFGRTPASIGNEPRAASPVNVFGKILGDSAVFRKVRSGSKIRIEKV